jgi:hypothetical protein
MVGPKAGHPFPALPSEDVSSETELAALGTKIADEVVSPGPNASLYVLARTSAHRNLYRVFPEITIAAKRYG